MYFEPGFSGQVNEDATAYWLLFKGNKTFILEDKDGRFALPDIDLYTGFVEPGETCEECVEREIGEEVSLKVKNIKYFGSQPWPFPDSLMIGFTAEYASGEIKKLMRKNFWKQDGFRYQVSVIGGPIHHIENRKNTLRIFRVRTQSQA